METTANNKKHEQFQNWWKKQPEHKNRDAMKIAWRAWKEADRQAQINAIENKRQYDLDSPT